MKIQMYLKHSNVIKMYGYFDDLSYIYILIEVALDGSLYQYLENTQRKERLKRSSILVSNGEYKQ